MSMAVGGAGGGPKSDINMTPSDRRAAGAADHLHGDHAADAAWSGGAGAPAAAAERAAAAAGTGSHRGDRHRQRQVDEAQPGSDPRRPAGRPAEEVFKTRAERVVFVKGDPDLDFQTVAQAIDIAKGAGMDKIGLMTPKIEAGQ